MISYLQRNCTVSVEQLDTCIPGISSTLPRFRFWALEAHRAHHANLINNFVHV